MTDNIINDIMKAVMRIVDGGLNNNQDMIARYVDKLADHIEQVEPRWANALREKLNPDANVIIQDGNKQTFHHCPDDMPPLGMHVICKTNKDKYVELFRYIPILDDGRSTEKEIWSDSRYNDDNIIGWFYIPV